jgi:hypothetical protein
VGAERCLERGDQMLSVSDPGVSFVSGDAAVALARQTNEYAAGVVRAHPRRFGAFAVLPLPNVDATIAEVGWGARSSRPALRAGRPRRSRATAGHHTRLRRRLSSLVEARRKCSQGDVGRRAHVLLARSARLDRIAVDCGRVRDACELVERALQPPG